MNEHDVANEVIERLEWHDSKKPQTAQSKARAVTRRAALTGGAGALAAYMLSPAAQAFAASGPSSIFGSQKKYKFVFVNHVTTNPFFTPTQYGIADACNLLGCSSQWTGSATSNVAEMVTAFNTAITGGADGIACAMIDPKAFTGPTAQAAAKKIPVLSYNADEPNGRLAYIGQDLFVSGQKMGAKIKSLLPGGGDVALFIATPGSANIQPRIDGAKQALKGTNITAHQVTTGAAVPQELTTIETFWTGHTGYKGLFAVDGGSTQSVGQTIQKYNLKGKVVGGGYDLTPITQTQLAAGNMAFTIDQQPYLQGFLPALELFIYQASKHLSGIADVDTGLKFLDQKTVAPYNNTKSRYEGTSAAPGVK